MENKRKYHLTQKGWNMIFHLIESAIVVLVVAAILYGESKPWISCLLLIPCLIWAMLTSFAKEELRYEKEKKHGNLY